MSSTYAKLLLIVVLAVALAGTSMAAPLVKIDLAKLPADRVAAGAVSEPQNLAGVACRLVRAGEKCAFAIDTWWGDALQPPAGAMYLATVRYQDTVDQPVRFLSYARLGGDEGPSEMHRFGGLADGKWKTARVPLSWDMLLADGSGRLQLGIDSKAGDLPVASIEIGPADADAQRRYNAQTRQWVRQVQAPLKPTAQIETQKPIIPPSMSDQVVLPYVRSYMSVIYPASAPQAGQAGAPVRVRMAVNEYEPATFAVYAAKKKLTNVTFEVSKLTGPSGTLAVQVDRGTVEYCLTSPGRRGEPVVLPQRIWPIYPVDIDQGKSHWFWITLKTDAAKSKPGKYTGQVAIRADQGRATLPIEVEVLPVKLLTMDEAGLLMGGCHPALIAAHEMDVLGEHNLNMMNIWSNSVGPRMKITDGKLELDFEFLDLWMQTARRHGMKAMVWFLGGCPYGYPRTMSLEREIYITLHAGEKPRKELYDEFVRIAGTKEHRGKTLPEIDPYYRQWVARVWQYSRDNNWPEIIMTPFDEPAMWVQGPYRKSSEKHPDVIGTGPWIKDHFKYACKLLHESAPGLRVYGSIHHNHVPGPDYQPPSDDEYPPILEGQVFIQDVDIFCTNAADEDPKLGDKVRAAGKTFWQYTGTGGGTRPAYGRFMFGFYFNAFNSRGSLIWAYDWGSGFDTSSGSNWIIGWRTPFGVIPGPDYECLREGWDDRRYVETLKAVAAQKKVDVSAFLAKLAADGIQLRGPGGRDPLHDAIDHMRRRVIAKIIELQLAVVAQ